MTIIQHRSHTAESINPSGKSCDVCGSPIDEGDTMFVGIIETGLIVNVAHCCRSILHSVFSQAQHCQTPEDPTRT